MKAALTVKEAAFELSICERLVRELIREGKLRAVRVGSPQTTRQRIIIPATEISRLLAPPEGDDRDRAPTTSKGYATATQRWGMG